MPDGLSKELSTQADVRTQCLRETSHEVFHHRSVVMNFSGGGFAARRLLLFQLLDLGLDTLVGAERLVEGAPLQASLLDRPHDPLCLPTKLRELARARCRLGLEAAR